MSVRITDGGLSWTASIDDSDLNRIADRVEGRINKMSTASVADASRMDSAFQKLSYTLGGALSVAAAANFVKELTNVRGAFQQIEIAFTTMLKSKEKADQLMKEAISLAATTPFSLKDVAGGAKQLLAYGFAANEITENLSKLGNIASGVSAPLNDIVYLYGTLKTQGRAYTRDIMQFTTRGIPIIGELAKQFGLTGDNAGAMVQELVEAGKVGFPEIEKAFNSMTGSAGVFFNLMQEQSKSLTGQLSNLSDAWDVMLNNIGKDTQGVLSGGIGVAADLVQNYEKVLDILGILITTYGVYQAAVIATAAYEKVSAASKFGVVVALNEESVARAVNSAAIAEELRAVVTNLAAKKAAAVQSATIAAAELATAKERLVTAELAQVQANLSITASAKAAAAKEVEVATNGVVAAQEKSALTRKAALSASSEFYTAKTSLETAAKGANAAVTTELTAVESLNAAGKRVLATATAAYNAVLAASPMIAFTAAAVALGLVIYSLTQVTNAAEEAENKLNEAREEGAKTADKEENSINELIGVIKSQTASVEQKKKAYDDLQKSTGGVLLGYSQEEIAAGKASKSIDDYIAKIREATTARKAFSEYRELADQLDELNRKGAKSIGTFERVGRSLKNTFAPTSQGLSLKEWARGLISTDDANATIVRQQKESVGKQMDLLKKEYGDKFDEIITGVDKKAKDNPIKIRTVSVIDEEIKNKKEAQEATSSRKEYASIQVEINKLEAEKTAITGKLNKAEQKQSNERLDALKEIVKAEQEARVSTLSKDEAEIQSAKDKYDALRAEAKKAGLGSGTITRIDRIEQKVTGNIRYDQDTEKLKASLEEQKKIYADYETYKKDFGETKAKERFAKELEFAKETTDKAAKEFAALNTASLFGPLTGNQQERFTLLQKDLQEQSQLKKAQQDADLLEALKASETYETKKKEIEDRYAKYKADLLKSTPAGEYAQREKELEQNKQDEINSAKDAAIEKQKIFDEFYKGIEDLSDKNAKQLVSDTKEVLDELVRLGKISPELAAKIGKDLKSTGKAIDERLPQRLGELASSLGSVANEVRNIDSGFGDMLGTLSNVVGSVGNIKSSISALKEAQGNGDLLGGLTAGLGIAGGAFSAISGIVSIFSKASEQRKKEEREQIEYSNQLQLKAIEAQTKAMERQLALIKDIYGSERIAKYGESIGDLNQKIVDSSKEAQDKLLLTGDKKLDELVTRLNNGESMDKIFDSKFNPIDPKQTKYIENFFKTVQKGNASKLSIDLSKGADEIERLQNLLDSGKLDETTAANVQSLIDYTNQYKETLNALKAETTGTTFGEITDSIVDMFAKGNASAEDFGKNFEEIMKKSILASFKRNTLEKALQGFYDDFAEKSEDGLNQGEIGDLQSLYNNIIANSQKQFDDLQKATGIDFASTEATTGSNLKGTIQRELTEQTGSELAAVLRAQFDVTKRTYDEMRMTNKQQMDIAMRSVNHLANIEQNTGDTVLKLGEAVTELKNIVINTKPGQSGRDVGIGVI